MQENTNNAADTSWADMLELDSPTSPKAPAVPSVPEPLPLDMLDTSAPACVRCSREVSLDKDGLCFECYSAQHAAPATAVHSADTGRAERAVAEIKAHAAKVKKAQEAVKAAAAQAASEQQDALRAELTRQVEPSLTVDRRERLFAGRVVAGSAAEGHGALTSWTGEKVLTVARAAEIGTEGGVAPEHLPKARKPETYAHAAIRDVAAKLGYYATKQKRDKLAADQDYDHRWRLQPLAVSGEAGDSAGRIALVATLKDAVLSFTTDGSTLSQLAAEAIERAYAELSGAQVLTAGQVTGWLGAYLRDHLGAVKYYRDWYVPQAVRPAADKLIAAFVASGWGKREEWHYPMTPIATSNQLAAGIAAGLKAEVEELHKDQEHDANATVNKQLGEQGARGYLQRYKNKLARVKAFELILGEELVRDVKAMVEAKVATLETALVGADDGLGIAKRFQLIWEEVEYDFAKAAKDNATEEVAS